MRIGCFANSPVGRHRWRPMRFLISLLILAHTSAAAAATLPGRVVRITDGDTIVILAEGNIQHKISLQGIDAPERNQAYGTKSKQHLSDLVAGRYVLVEYDDRDRHGRTEGKVLVADQDACLAGTSRVFRVLPRSTELHIVWRGCGGPPLSACGGVAV